MSGVSDGHRSLDRSALMAGVDWDLELFETVFEVFESDCPRLLATIEESLKNEDADALERAAHSLRGSLGVFGAIQAAACAEQLETAARESDIAEGRERYAELRESVLRMEAELRTVLAELEGTTPDP